MTNHTPAWRAAWRLDDPEWVKARKQGWKKIKNSPAIEDLFMPKKEELKRIRNFYLTGSAFDPEPPEEEWRWTCYHPDREPVPVSKAMLVELWLTADESEENWRHIDEKYSADDHRDARWAFRDALQKLYPEHGSIFDGREERIYKLLGPTRCRREDYADFDEDRFRKKSKSVNAQVGPPIKALLAGDLENSDEFVPVLAREWSDSIPGVYEYAQALISERPKLLPIFMKGLEEVLSKASAINKNPEQFTSSQILLASNVINYLSEMELPAPLIDSLGEYLES